MNQLNTSTIQLEQLNIVEGKNRKGDNEFIQFLYISRASNQEVHCLLHISKDLGYISKELSIELTRKCEEVNKMINGLIRVP